MERYHLSYDRECLAIHRPSDLVKVIECTTTYQHHYNWERPNQAISCGNLPPRVAFPDLPKRPGLPTMVDPDAWLNHIRGRFYRRQVKSNGTVQIGRQPYYISRQLRGQSVALQVDAEEKCLMAFQDNNPVKQVPLKGLYHGLMLFEDYVPLIQAEAVSDYRRYLRRRYYH